MDNEDKQKNIYDLKYQTSLNYLNIFLAGILGTWITLFFQTSIELNTKWIMTAVFINISIVIIVIFYYYSSNIISRIDRLKTTHPNQLHPSVLP